MTVPRLPYSGELPYLDESCTLALCGKKRIRAKRKFKPQGLILIVAIVMIALRTFLTQIPRDHGSMPGKLQLSLARFPSLAYPLANAKLVALYFGASYCSENRLLRDSFLRDERLLPQEGLLPYGTSDRKYPLAIVYISSDNVEGSSQWIHVNDENERASLKRKFRVGTAEEATKLDTTAHFPVPSLLVIDSDSNGVMTPMGLVDLKERGTDALEGWLQFQTTIEGIDPSVWAASELFRDGDDGAKRQS